MIAAALCSVGVTRELLQRAKQFLPYYSAEAKGSCWDILKGNLQEVYKTPSTYWLCVLPPNVYPFSAQSDLTSAWVPDTPALLEVERKLFLLTKAIISCITAIPTSHCRTKEDICHGPVVSKQSKRTGPVPLYRIRAAWSLPLIGHLRWKYAALVRSIHAIDFQANFKQTSTVTWRTWL